MIGRLVQTAIFPMQYGADVSTIKSRLDSYYKTVGIHYSWVWDYIISVPADYVSIIRPEPEDATPHRLCVIMRGKRCHMPDPGDHARASEALYPDSAFYHELGLLVRGGIRSNSKAIHQ
jgi:hypothetical protein